MACTQKQHLALYPKARVPKYWFRYFNNHKNFHNSGTLHLFSLMSLYSYANYRSFTRRVDNRRYLESPGESICKISALPRILRVRTTSEAVDLMDYFSDCGFLKYAVINKDTGLIRYTITDWRKHCPFQEFNYYSKRKSGFFFFPHSVARKLMERSRQSGEVIYSELDAIMDLWLHTVLNDSKVTGSEYMPVVYFSDMDTLPLLSYSYLARRWNWTKSRVGRFILKLEEAAIISRISFTSSHGSILSPCRFREMIYGEDEEVLDVQRMGEILKIANLVELLKPDSDIEINVQSCVSSKSAMIENAKALKIQVFRVPKTSFFARPVPVIFYSSLVCGEQSIDVGTYRGPFTTFAKEDQHG